MPLRHQIVDNAKFNKQAQLPYQLRLADFELAMQDVYDFFHDVNELLIKRGMRRLDDMLRPAAMSGILSDMLTAAMAKHARSLIENRHFNGHPDLVVQGVYANNSVKAGEEGVEIKSTRKKRVARSIRTARATSGCAYSFMRPITQRSQPSIARRCASPKSIWPKSRWQTFARIRAGNWAPEPQRSIAMA